MALHFYKYQGTGNDFIIIDNRTFFFKNDTKLIRRLCDRKMGIGADGLILLQLSEKNGEDFEMVYFNADGAESSMCGNGGRCIAAFANKLGIVYGKAVFSAIDGVHRAIVENENVSLQMGDVSVINKMEEDIYFTDTGSPHHIIFTNQLQAMNVAAEGAAIRNNETYREKGVNVNFVQPQEDGFFVRTYERGVEAETLSCGTGVTAVALAAHFSGKVSDKKINIQTPGGQLAVSFEKTPAGYQNIWLTGPAIEVFQGEIIC